MAEQGEVQLQSNTVIDTLNVPFGTTAIAQNPVESIDITCNMVSDDKLGAQDDNKIVTLLIIHEGYLQYEVESGEWKQAWFVLDQISSTLIRCDTKPLDSEDPQSKNNEDRLTNTTVHEHCQSKRNVSISNREFRRGYPVYHLHSFSELRTQSSVLSKLQKPLPSQTGLEFSTTALISTSRSVRLLTHTADEEHEWYLAIKSLEKGFTDEVAGRIAGRFLLAGKYSLVRELGRGAGGVVSLYTWHGQPFAIKKFLPQKQRNLTRRLQPPGSQAHQKSHSVSSNSKIPEDIRREIALLKKVSKLPSIIHLHEVILDETEGNYYVVMEYMGGGALGEWHSDKNQYTRNITIPGKPHKGSFHKTQKDLKLEIELLKGYILQVAQGLEALHHNRICHRDIKPENLMLSGDERMQCKIGDLGVAHYFTETADGNLQDETNVESIEDSVNLEDDVTFDGEMNGAKQSALKLSGTHTPLEMSSTNKSGLLRSTKGTYPFLPPEALSGKSFCGFKADIWALGVTIYALLYGNLPYYSVDVMELFDIIGKNPLVFPVDAQERDPLAVDLIQHVLEKDPLKRLTLSEIIKHEWFTCTSTDISSQCKWLDKAKQIAHPLTLLCVNDNELVRAVNVIELGLSNRLTSISTHIKSGRMKDHKTENSNSHSLKCDEIQDEEYASTSSLSSSANHIPYPINTKAIAEFPYHIFPKIVIHQLVSQLHYDWCLEKFISGWTYGPKRQDKNFIHPLLVPIRELPRDAINRNLACVLETLTCIVALNCQIIRPPAIEHLKEVKSSPTTPKSKLRKSDGVKISFLPLATNHVVLDWNMLMLIDLLAEHSHEIWVQSYLDKGWRNGSKYDSQDKTHPSLCPYMKLNETEKNGNRQAVKSIIKTCILLGYKFSCSRSQPV